jgi:hypothetical protein
VATLRSCTVSFSDSKGEGTFSVQVTAQSIYEAAAKALKLFRDEPWSSDSSQATGYLEIFVRAPEVRYKVLLSDLERWLEQPGGSPRELAMRQELKKLLS